MCIQYGSWSFHDTGDRGVFPRLHRAAQERRPAIVCHSHVSGGLRFGFGALQGAVNPEQATQPLGSFPESVLTLDGRLDNAAELAAELNCNPGTSARDGDIVIAAFRRWGVDCLGKLLGDWALVLWDNQEHRLILARDFVGTKRLFYQATAKELAWSTTARDLIEATDPPLLFDQDYLAGYFILSPPADRTAYQAISQVPPCSAVIVRDGELRVARYRSFDEGRRTLYIKDRDYEAHFLQLFATSVRRRLRSGAPVFAELSGGMDSSSIVCIADRLAAEGRASLPRLETISYFDRSEPNWDEQNYFSLVEARRGRPGVHLDVSGGFSFEPPSEADNFQALPPELDDCAADFEQRRLAAIEEKGAHVLLSGIGGDEFLGGVPTPIPELADLLAQGRFSDLLRSAHRWSLARRQPLVDLLSETVGDFFPARVRSLRRENRIPRWLRTDFVQRHKEIFLGCTSRSSLRGARPSFRANLAALESIRRQLSAGDAQHAHLYEIRYPYLDRDLLEFLFSVPREQLVRPGRRRSLMRRALAGIVPEEILERRRKAFVVRGPMEALAQSWEQITQLTTEMVSEELGLIDREAFLLSLERARQGHEEPVVLLIQTLRLELWLRRVLGRQVSTGDRTRGRTAGLKTTVTSPG